MRCSLLGLVAVAAWSSPVFAQVPAPAAALPSTHPWYIKAEAGQWMICVKSYSGTNAKDLAEQMAKEIRETYKISAYLFERGSEEKKKEELRYAAEVAKKKDEEEKKYRAFADKMREQAAAKGMEFLESPAKVRVPTIKYEEQYAVMIGGWPDMATARKELDKVRTWQPPKNAMLMDTSLKVDRDKNGTATSAERVTLNPFLSAMVVPNPVAQRTMDTEGETDLKFIHKMNAEEELSVLKIQKSWTIVVKQFTPPPEIRGKGDERSIVAKLFTPQQDILGTMASQSRSLADSLRNMKPTPGFPYGPYESYVLHTKYGSLTCVGQFDSDTDPKLMEMQNQLGLMTFDVEEMEKDPKTGKLAKTGRIKKGQRMFDRLYAMRVK